MPIDPQRFPRQDRPKVEIRRRTIKPATAPVQAASSVVDAPVFVFEAEAPDVLPFVAPARSVDVATRIVETPSPVAAQTRPRFERPQPKPAPQVAPTPTPTPPIDSRVVLLKPSELTPKEVPTLRYDSAELGPMLEEMAVRKVLLEQTLSRMKQALDEERDELVREARGDAVEEERPAAPVATSNLAPSTPSPTAHARLGLFFWLGSAVGALLLGLGLFWLLRAALLDPTQLRPGAAIALFGAVAIASNVVLHLDAFWPRGASRTIETT